MHPVEPSPSKIQRLAEFLGAGRRRPPTIRRWMATIALVAVVLGVVVAERTHMQRWEARRQEMYIQHDVTQAIVFETMRDLLTADPNEAKRPPGFTDPGKSNTRVWWITVNDREAAGNRPTPDRARISGANGEFALRPISIEIRDPRLRRPFLDRLEPAYRQWGWRFEVVSPD